MAPAIGRPTLGIVHMSFCRNTILPIGGAFLLLLGTTGCGGKVAVAGSGGSVPDQESVIGKECVDDSDCPGHSGDAGIFGDSPGCAKTTFGTPLPDGYCTMKCSPIADCPGPAGEAVCGAVKLEAGMVGSFCYRVCHPDAASTGCREGYSCVALNTQDPSQPAFGCWIWPW